MAVVFRISCHNDQIIFTINRNALPPTVWNMARLKFWCQTDYCLEYRLVNRQTFAFRFIPLVLHKNATYFTRFICVNQYNYL